METINDHFVGMQGGKIVIVMPPMAPMSIAEALRLAAWIVTIAADDDEFNKVLEAIRGT